MSSGEPDPGPHFLIPPTAVADAQGMAHATPAPMDLLAATSRCATMESLQHALAEKGIRMDLAQDMESARQNFFDRGGHDLLVLGPDLTPKTAMQLIENLQALDPDLPIVIFGSDLLRHEEINGCTRLSYHPSSRAAVGALMKILTLM